ncbi:MAG TPA: hypothetical protein VFS08_17215 [Gemmatimonadaceae bacterium]|nr:hypothetical protein [Gemmatimonadaceae bacterium]
MTHLLPPAYWALTAVILLWDVQLAGRIARQRAAPRPLALLSALAGLLVVPAALAAAAAPSLLSGHAVQAIAWLWPVVNALCAVQVLYAVARRYVTPAVGLPFLLYDLVTTAVAVARYATLRGGHAPPWLVALSAAQAGAIGTLLGEPALWSPLTLAAPLIAPVAPARWRLTATVRGVLAVVVAAWAGLVLLVEYPRAVRAVRAFAPFGEARLQERPAGDLEVGLHLFPTLERPPSEQVVTNDLALLDSLDADAVSLTLAPEAATLASLDSVAHILDDVRRDSTRIVIALGYPDDARARYAASPERYAAAQIAALRRVVRRLRPDIVLPAVEPYGAGARALGELPLAAWQRYLTAAARAVNEDRPRTQVGVSVASFGARDSALYAWAADRGSPIEVVGFSLAPSFDGGLSLAARLDAAERWLRAADPRRAPKPHWIFRAAAYPLAHGEQGQRDALWGLVAWATAHPQIRGVVVADAADYGRVSGLRVTGGRLRAAAGAVAEAVRTLHETVPQ